MIAGGSVGKHSSHHRGLAGRPGPGSPGLDHPDTGRPGPGGARRTRRQWAGGRIRLRRRRARLVRVGGAGSGRLRIHSLPALEPHRDVCERVDGWTHQMTRDQMLWSAHHQVADEHARGGGTWFRLPSKELPHLRLKSKPDIPSMAHAMLHVAPEAAAVGTTPAPGTMHLRPAQRRCVGGRYPRRRTQYSETTQDQQVRIWQPRGFLCKPL